MGAKGLRDMMCSLLFADTPLHTPGSKNHIITDSQNHKYMDLNLIKRHVYSRTAPLTDTCDMGLLTISASQEPSNEL